ncbi:MAG: hypothetical protein QF371_06165, partial [Flavobacteriales bacterium]|nr:hypothetical protein [Flavobacteriales bacterium]
MKKLIIPIGIIFIFFSNCSAQNLTRLGLGYGGEYNGEDFVSHINDLELDHYYINIKWGLFEFDSGQYEDVVLDAFLDQLPANSEALVRISTRGNELYNDSTTGYTVPL